MLANLQVVAARRGGWAERHFRMESTIIAVIAVIASSILRLCYSTAYCLYRNNEPPTMA